MREPPTAGVFPEQVNEGVGVKTSPPGADAEHHAGAEDSPREMHLPVARPAAVAQGDRSPHARRPIAPVRVEQRRSSAASGQLHLGRLVGGAPRPALRAGVLQRQEDVRADVVDEERHVDLHIMARRVGRLYACGSGGRVAVDIRSHLGRGGSANPSPSAAVEHSSASAASSPRGDQLLDLPDNARSTYLYPARAPLLRGHTLCAGHETKRQRRP